MIFRFLLIFSEHYLIFVKRRLFEVQTLEVSPGPEYPGAAGTQQNCSPFTTPIARHFRLRDSHRPLAPATAKGHAWAGGGGLTVAPAGRPSVPSEHLSIPVGQEAYEHREPQHPALQEKNIGHR